ncbi:MAG: hypothetical protein ACKO4A_04470 [Gammaproteobacteria bacterium]
MPLIFRQPDESQRRLAGERLRKVEHHVAFAAMTHRFDERGSLGADPRCLGLHGAWGEERDQQRPDVL